MARKKIGIYSDDITNISDHQLILEFGNDELVCIAKSAISGEIIAFELFSLDKGLNDDWNDIFYEVKAISQVFNFSYKKVTCFFNNEEALLIPEKLLTATSAEDYLSLVYGESTRHDVKYEKLLATKVFINAYRVRKAITELLSRHFIIYQTAHTYSTILNDVMRRPIIDPAFIKIQFYSSHFIIAVWKDERFQLIQSYRYKSTEDVLYYVMRIVQQYHFDFSEVLLEVSGLIDKELSLYTQLSTLFNRITTDNMQLVGVFKTVEGEYPPHYFTPFYKLTL
ncbi:MAG: DUF3822 family protein [Ignavibacteria bacterium]|nr:DUF3822 family protein [Ignavibacteria bacterium]